MLIQYHILVTPNYAVLQDLTTVEFKDIRKAIWYLEDKSIMLRLLDAWTASSKNKQLSCTEDDFFSVGLCMH